MAGLTIWTNHDFRPEALARLQAGLARAGHRLLFSPKATPHVLAAGQPDPLLAEADIAYGQPVVEDAMRLPRLRWIALSSAGYTRYDRADFRAALRARGAVATNASQVFADPCAHHLLAQMLALTRNLPAQVLNQHGPREWRYLEDRFTNGVLTGQCFLLLGYGAIGKRLAELLQPFGGRIIAHRRKPTGDEGVEVVTEAGLPAALAAADHVCNSLPDSDATKRFMNAARLAQMKPGARLYNVGRGETVDQPALLAALESGRVGAAYLDALDPEPLPPDHPLWTARNCHITCHIGGGTRDQDDRLARHFLDNLRRFERGEALVDRIA